MYNNSEDQVKGGNGCLFFVLQILNLIFALSSLGLIALGIWLWHSLKAFNTIQIFFMILGVFEIILVMIAWSARRSVTKLRCYIILLGLLFIAQLTVTIIAFVLKDKIINEVVQKTGAEKQSIVSLYDLVETLKSHYDFVTYYVVGSLALIIMLLGFTYSYIGSVKNKNFAYDYKVLDEQGKKITIQQKTANDTQKIQDKYSQKKEDMSSKYPSYGQYKNQS